MTGHSNWIILSHANIYHDILFSCFFLVKKKKKTDLKGILSDGLCFSVERRVIFPLRNVKCKDYIQLYISCQFVETTHLKLICIQRMKSCSLHVHCRQEKNKKKRLPSFLQMFSKVQHFKGRMTVSDD